MTLPPRPLLHQPLLTISLLYGRWSTSGSDRGNAHFFTATSNTIEGTGEKRKKKKTTNEQTLGVNSSAKGELCNIEHVQTNANVDSSETSTKLVECRLILTRSSFTGLDPLACRPRLSAVPVSTASVRRPSPTPDFELRFSTLFWRPLTTSGHVEIAGPKSFVWFCAKTDKGIVCLADHLYSVT